LPTGRLGPVLSIELVGKSRCSVHDAIARASHNAMGLRLHASVIAMLREHITISGTGMREHGEDSSELLLLQRRPMGEAICERRPEEGHTAMQRHIDFVRNWLERTEG